MKSIPLEEFYTAIAVGGVASGTLLPPGTQQEVGHFSVFNVADLMPGYHNKPPMAFDRRAFYKISLIRGRSRVEYADKVADIDQYKNASLNLSNVPIKTGSPKSFSGQKNGPDCCAVRFVD